MAAKKNQSKFGANKFKSGIPSDSRTTNVRQERKVAEDAPKLTFNFKDFDFSQSQVGQTLEQWQTEKLLAKLVQKFIEVSACTRQEAEQMGLLKIYGEFPKKSAFKIPQYIEGEVAWGTIRKIGGQKPRLAGYIIGSVFYPVFLDKDHLFYPSEKKNT
jgi:hypothetical protein